MRKLRKESEDEEDDRKRVSIRHSKVSFERSKSHSTDDGDLMVGKKHKKMIQTTSNFSQHHLSLPGLGVGVKVSKQHFEEIPMPSNVKMPPPIFKALQTKPLDTVFPMNEDTTAIPVLEPKGDSKHQRNMTD